MHTIAHFSNCMRSLVQVIQVGSQHTDLSLGKHTCRVLALAPSVGMLIAVGLPATQPLCQTVAGHNILSTKVLKMELGTEQHPSECLVHCVLIMREAVDNKIDV